MFLCGSRVLPQSPYCDSSLPEGAFGSHPLLQYRTSGKCADKQRYGQRLPPGGSCRRKATEGERGSNTETYSQGCRITSPLTNHMPIDAGCHLIRHGLRRTTFPSREGKDAPAAVRTTTKEHSVPAAAGSRSGARRTDKQRRTQVTARPREAVGAKSTLGNDKTGAKGESPERGGSPKVEF